MRERNAAFQAVPARAAGASSFHVVIDTPAGSCIKNKYDPLLGRFRPAKVMPAGLVFPCNFGFIPNTRGEDGDELDVAILFAQPLEIGVVARVRVLGAIRARQREGTRSMRNDRFVASLQVEGAPPVSRKQLEGEWMPALESFFISYNELLGRRFTVTGRVGSRDAARLIRTQAETVSSR